MHGIREWLTHWTPVALYLIIWSFAIASVLGALPCFLGTRGLAHVTEKLLCQAASS